MTAMLVLDKSWERTQDVARELHGELGVSESQAKCMILRRGNGWRIVVTRYADSATAAKTIGD